MDRLTFKEFSSLVDMPDEEFSSLVEGLSDLPGFGWLKSRDNKMKLAKIDAERKKLQAKRDQKSREMDAKWAAMKASIEAGDKPGLKGVLKTDDISSAMSAQDRKAIARQEPKNRPPSR